MLQGATSKERHTEGSKAWRINVNVDCDLIERKCKKKNICARCPSNPAQERVN